MDTDESESELTRLTDFTLVDEEMAVALRDAGYETVEHVAAATTEQLQHVDGVNRGIAGRLKVETEGIDPSHSVLETVKDIHESVTHQPESETEDQPDFDSLTDIAIVDEQLATQLREAGYESVADLSLANTDDLAQVDGIPRAVAARLDAVTEGVETTEVTRASETELDHSDSEDS
jgi:large subunit ribosomal protein L32e